MKKVSKFFMSLLLVQLFVNTIALAQTYTTVLDEIYKRESLTMEMEAPEWLKMAGAKAKSVLIPKVTVDGLKNYSRSSGYLTGDNTFEYETHTYSIDRGIQFTVDRADDMETIDTAFAFFSREFMRTQVVPEIDAYRFATLAGRATSGTNLVNADLTKDTALQAWDDAMEYWENAEISKEGMMCYMSPTFKKYVKQSNLIERQYITNAGFMAINREVDTLDGMMIKTIPQSRFYTQITLQTGNDSGYVKTPSTSRDINFMLVDPMAALADKKIDALKIFTPEVHQGGDSWLFQYRVYHDIFSPDNKIPGIYVHAKNTF